MRTYIGFRHIWLLFALTIVVTQIAQAGGDRYPVFVDCPDRITGSHCDSFFVQVRAVDPTRDHPNNANIRYHLVSGPGVIDDRTGWWYWYADTAEYDWWQEVQIAASIGNSAEHMTPPEEYCRFTVDVDDEPSHVFLDGQPHNSVFFVTAPGVHYFGMEVIDPDFCDTPTVEIFRVYPRPAGSFYIENDKLVFEADAADDNKKFLVTLFVPVGPSTLVQDFIFDTQEDPMPVFSDCPEDMVITQCDRPKFNLGPTHTANVSSHGIICEMVAGPGRIEHNRFWVFEPTEADIGQTYEVEIAARYAHLVTTGDENCHFSVTVEEQPAGINPLNFTCGDSLAIPATIESSFRLRAFGGDCQPLWMRISDVSPPFQGLIDIVGTRGSTSPAAKTHELIIEPDTLDIGGTFDIVLEGSAFFGFEPYTCSLTVTVEEPQPYRVRIETLENARQGEYAFVDVVLEEASIPMGRFDFVIAYEQSAIAAIEAVPGPFLQQCEWELFAYRFGPFGPWYDGIPSGQMRITGRADNGPYGLDPICFLPNSLPTTLFTIKFLVTNDRTFACDSIPVAFHWQYCYDNRIQSKAGGDGFISREVYDSEGSLLLPPDSLRSYAGAPDKCLGGSRRYPCYRLIDFYSGGIHIICADSIDPRVSIGDINLNGVPYEVADAVLFTNYFVYGDGVLNIDPYRQAAASDANRDGELLTIEDLQWLIRVITENLGWSDPYDTTSPNAAVFRQEADGSVEVLTPDTLGSAWLVFGGNVTPMLAAHGMEMRYAYDGTANTNVLVYSFDGHNFTAGPILANAAAPLIEVQTCTYDGAKVEAVIDQALDADGEDEENLPGSFALGQNFPNPFNSQTLIRFDLPHGCEVTHTIYNVIGQVLLQKTRYYPAGGHQFIWDGRSSSGEDAAAGVYFYRLQAGSFTETKKMILLK